VTTVLLRDRRDAVRLGPLITHRIPFARAAEAYELVDQRPEETVQVILTYD